ncbi:carboxylesterase/lipase family protein [Gordonia hankookensis]|uniref:Carboxylic ester hydrolase n=1 Tax=Gordonia hankookensis TaxID=589403 RepID=A0ABR7WA22_9ACTN|nr:carboxylesterase/lipase family protein [Gordonia hankookensis]MBD1319123.1 carboxylesterase/lipase family protein [Gordonia hankookensis]
MTSIDSRVTTADGIVEGARGKRTRRGTISWKGIPFAAPPVAGLRFRDPQPVNPWPGVRDCTRFAKAAIQEKQFTAVAPGKYQPVGEDCLTLNVFAPDRPSSTPRPVMFFIHGGAYILGTAATPLYEGSLLARAQDVVVVTVQYRFGPFGFLDFGAYATDDRPFDSNLGLKDHVAALSWVQRNIAAFGGDPDNVTVFGESAGGTSVVSLLSTPAANGLFTRAIAESPATELVIGKDSARIYADEFLRLLRDPQRRSTQIDTEAEPISAADAQALLARSSANEIHRAGDRLMKFAAAAGVDDAIPYGPVVDGDYLPASPLDAAAAGTTLPVPLIIGSNHDEGQLFTKFWNVLPDAEKALVRVTDEQDRREIRALYNGGQRDDVQLAADAVFWAPMVAFAEGHSRVAPTYVYRYDFHTRILAATGVGATHATELFAVFGAYRTALGAGLAVGDWRSTGRVIADVQDRWGAFATGGVPGVGWPAYESGSRKVLIIDDPDRVQTDPEGARRAAWQKVHASA